HAHRLRPADPVLPRHEERAARVPQHLPPSRHRRLPRARGQRAAPHLLLSRLDLRPRRQALCGARAEGLSAGVQPRGDSLKEAPRVESYKGFVFLNFDANAIPLNAYLGNAKEYIDLVVDQSPSGQMQVLEGTQEYDIRANWKVLVENSFDDYHLLTTHSTWLD